MILSIFAVGTFLIRKILIWILRKYVKSGSDALSGLNFNLITEVQGIRTLQQWNDFIEKKSKEHNKQEDIDDLIVSTLRMSSMSIQESIDASTLLYAMELEIHGSKADAHCCLKESLDSGLFSSLNNYIYPGFKDKMVPKAYRIQIKQAVEQCKSTRIGRFFNIFSRLFIFYVDPVKDFTFWFALISLVGSSNIFDPDYFNYFQIQVTWILGMSLFLPLFVSAVQIARDHPLAIFGYMTEKEKQSVPAGFLWLIQCIVIILFPLMPAMLILAIVEEEEILTQLAKEVNENSMKGEKNKIMRQIIGRNAFIKNTKGVVLTMKVNEVLENMCNLIIQTLMLALHQTSTSTTRGLETVFTSERRVSTELLLLLSVIWSLRTSITTRIKAKKAALGGFMPSVASALIGVRALLNTGVKVGCVLFFFAPYMGLFDILSHWHAEKLPLASDLNMMKKMRQDLFRSDTGYEYYIGELREGYLFFLGLIVLNIFLIFCIHITTSGKFRQNSRWSMLQRTMNDFSFPDSNQDWSEGAGSVSDHSLRRKEHLIEVLLIASVQWIMHLCMCIPIWISGTHPFYSAIYCIYFMSLFSAKKIEDRHQVLLDTIGTFHDENQSFQFVQLWKWLFPLLITLFWLLDMVLIITFHTLIHPWADIIKDDKMGDMVAVLDRAKEIIAQSMTVSEILTFLKNNEAFSHNLITLLKDKNTSTIVQSIGSMSDEKKRNLLIILQELLQSHSLSNAIHSFKAKSDSERDYMISTYKQRTNESDDVSALQNIPPINQEEHESSA